MNSNSAMTLMTFQVKPTGCEMQNEVKSQPVPSAGRACLIHSLELSVASKPSRIFRTLTTQQNYLEGYPTHAPRRASCVIPPCCVFSGHPWENENTGSGVTQMVPGSAWQVCLRLWLCGPCHGDVPSRLNHHSCLTAQDSFHPIKGLSRQCRVIFSTLPNDLFI